MTAPLWTSALLGLALAGANVAASLLLLRAARGRAPRAWFAVVFGGMTARLFVLLAVLAGVLVWAPVHRPTFVGVLLAACLAGLAAEVALVHRAALRAQS